MTNGSQHECRSVVVSMSGADKHVAIASDDHCCLAWISWKHERPWPANRISPACRLSPTLSWAFAKRQSCVPSERLATDSRDTPEDGDFHRRKMTYFHRFPPPRSFHRQSALPKSRSKNVRSGSEPVHSVSSSCPSLMTIISVVVRINFDDFVLVILGQRGSP